jgi:hypothetical protein
MNGVTQTAKNRLQQTERRGLTDNWLSAYVITLEHGVGLKTGLDENQFLRTVWTVGVREFQVANQLLFR